MLFQHRDTSNSDWRSCRLPSSKSSEFIQVGQGVHEGGDVGHQLHGSGQRVGASGSGGLHNLLQGFHYHLHRPPRTPSIRVTQVELLIRMQVSA